MIRPGRGRPEGPHVDGERQEGVPRDHGQIERGLAEVDDVETARNTGPGRRSADRLTGFGDPRVIELADAAERGGEIVGPHQEGVDAWSGGNRIDLAQTAGRL